jgi:hypothetical protein
MANSNQNIETPPEFVLAVENLLGIKFEYDMAGTEENKKAPIVFTEAQDSLSVDWPTDGWCWLNPPFKHVGKFVKKCVEQMDLGCRVVSIWPLSGDFNMIPAWKWSQVYVIHGRIWPEVRGCMLCVWGVDIESPKGLIWDKKNKTLKKEW